MKRGRFMTVMAGEVHESYQRQWCKQDRSMSEAKVRKTLRDIVSSIHPSIHHVFNIQQCIMPSWLDPSMICDQIKVVLLVVCLARAASGKC
jgi:hypothetical protein